MTDPGKWDVFSTTLSVFCVCIAPLSISPEHYLMWVGRIAIITAFLASAVSLFLNRKNNVYSALIATAILCLIIIGLVAADVRVPQTYIQILQLLIFGTIVAEHRKLQVSPSLYTVLLAVIAAAVGVNFAFPAPVQADDTHSFSQMVGVVGNPNILALFWCALFMLVFSLLRAASLTWHRILSCLACGAFVYLVVDTGGRTALIALFVYAVVYGAGRILKGNKRMALLAAASMLLLVPVITVVYPIALGKQIRFRCVPTIAETCRNAEVERPADTDNLPKMTDGGYFGINKNLASGRQNIWPAIIQLSGDSMIWGHGLGSLPGAYLAWPYHGRSAHNGFLQVYFQFGLAGTALYLFLWSLLFVRASNIPDIVARSTAIATLCAICILEIFEVVLIQNLFGIGIALAIVATTEFVRSGKTASP